MTERDLPWSDAAERNAEPIARVLERWLQPGARVLEVGSGTGQHAVYFSGRLNVDAWQASERREHLANLKARLEHEAGNLPAPIELDVVESQWPSGPWEVVFTANTLHIMPWKNTPTLLEQSARVLAAGGLLAIYGPFHDAGRYDTESNRKFDQSLQMRDPAMGLRDVREVIQIGERAGLLPEAEIAMPANNRTLIFRKPQ
jgi:cyclopropane fatty-acyl-phospholipid synthase-like methyltransferase